MMAVPDRMKGLPCDHRGYPVPWIVFLDNAGDPHFTINDEHKVWRCRIEDRCSICGQPLLRGRWFIGGPMSALHPMGAYIDPPLHHECMQFAASTCPYLISSKYTKRIDGKTLDPAKTEGVLGFMDPTMDPTRPKVFIAVMAVGQTYTPNGYVKPRHPYRAIEVWRDGKMIERFERDRINQAFKYGLGEQSA